MGRKHLIIADCQVKPKANLDHLTALGNFIVAKKPEVIVNIGDFWDFPSLSSYDRGKRSFEGRRVVEDIKAGHKGMEALLRPLNDYNKRQKRNRKKLYNPEMHFTLGNHEERADRFANDNPEFAGFIGTDVLNIEEYGWEVHEFLKPVFVDGICYVHYLANPFNGRPYGGTSLNILKNVGTSFVVGHKQCLDVAIRPTLDGKMQLGIVNGAYYPHNEDYKGYQGNNHFRGITMLHEVEDGFGSPQFTSIKFLMEKYL